MHRGKQNSQRKGLTLVELLVVISIIILVAALAAAFMPRVQERQNITRGTDLLTQWLLSSRQRARRDNRVTGVQLTQGPGDSGTQYSQAVYLQQPLPYSTGVCTGVQQVNGVWTAYFSGVDFTNGGNLPQNEWSVQPGDYLQLNGLAVNGITGVIPASGGQPLSQLTLASGAPMNTPTSNYRINRMPRAIAGEPVLQLPGTVVVDLSIAHPGLGAQTQILFAPNGAVMGAGVGGGKIAWCLKDSASQDVTLGGVVAVQTQTGFIASYDIGPPGNEFFYADSGSDEGL